MTERLFPDWDTQQSPTLAELYDDMPSKMVERPFGRSRSGEPLDEAVGVAMVPFIKQTLKLVATQRAEAEGSPLDGERFEEHRAAALDDLIELLNACISEPDYHIDAQRLMSRRSTYSLEFDEYLSKCCFELADRNPELHVLVADATFSPTVAGLARSVSLREAYPLLCRTSRFTHTEEMYAELDGPTSALVRWSARNVADRFDEPLWRAYTRSTCFFLSSSLASLPREHSGLERARFTELECQLDGAEYCVWHYEWDQTRWRGTPALWAGIVMSLLLSAWVLSGLAGTSVLRWLVLVPALVGLILEQRTVFGRERKERDATLSEQRELADSALDRSVATNRSLQTAASDLQHQVRQIEHLNRVGTELSQVQSADVISQIAVDAPTVRLGFDHASLYVLSDVGELELLSQASPPVGTDPIEPEKRDELLKLMAGAETAVVRSEEGEWLGAPLVSDDQTLGILVVDNATSGRVLGPEDVSLLTTFSTQLATAFARTQLYETLEDRVRQRTVQLEEARQVAEEVSIAKSSFLANVSHELRTPLTSILGFAQLVAKRVDDRVAPAVDPNDARAVKAIDTIRSNLQIVDLEGRRLTMMINDVLDLEKIESGEMTWNLDPIRLTSVVEQALASVESLAMETDALVTSEVQADLPQITGDHDRLVQVMINLVSNALKFAAGGEVTITVRQHHDGALGSTIETCVSDNGPGIAPDELEAVFDKFRQAGDMLTEKPSGTGLGLPICREIVEYHGGRIWAESSPGLGTSFFFLLPMN